MERERERVREVGREGGRKGSREGWRERLAAFKNNALYCAHCG